MTEQEKMELVVVDTSTCTLYDFTASSWRGPRTPEEVLKAAQNSAADDVRRYENILNSGGYDDRKPAFLTLRAHVTPALPTTTAPAAIVKNMTAFWPTRTRPAANRAALQWMIWPESPKRSKPSAKRTMMFPPLPLRCPGASFRTSSRSKSPCPGSPPGHLVLYCGCLKYAFFGAYVLKMRIFVSKSRLSVQK